MLNPVTPNFEAQLRGILPQAAFKDPAPYLSEPRGRWTGQGLVVAPSSTEDVAAVVKACAQAGVGIVPFSGGPNRRRQPTRTRHTADPQFPALPAR